MLRTPVSRAIASRHVVFPDRVGAATVWIEDGHIERIELDRIDPRAEDWGSDHLLPGLVELHTDHIEPHLSPRPKVHWNPAAAVLAYDGQIATAGITTVYDCLRAGTDLDLNLRLVDLYDVADAIVAAGAAGRLRVDHHIHLRCEIAAAGVLDDVDSMVSRFPVHLMSLMDHTPGQRQYRDVDKLRHYYRTKSGKTDAEIDEFFAMRLDQHAANYETHLRKLIDMAQSRGIQLASHDDTTVEQVALSKSLGVAIAEFPTTVEAAEALHREGIAVMMGAPNVVRGGSHSGNVAAMELAERGCLDVLSSDYIPASLLYAAVMLRDVPAVGGLAAAIRLVTKAPAEAIGLTDRGAIAVDRRADILRADLTDPVPLVREVHVLGRRVA
jgi:alpha-D-ribose 1-methylphosphonate 5-triphosphate diphosphatase